MDFTTVVDSKKTLARTLVKMPKFCSFNLKNSSSIVVKYKNTTIVWSFPDKLRVCKRQLPQNMSRFS